MNQRENKINVTNTDDDELLVLTRQLSAIQKSLCGIAKTREIKVTFCDKNKLGFKLTKLEVKEMPERIRKIFIANNYIVNYRITSNGYYEARIRRSDMYIEVSGRDFETMRKRFMDRLSAYYNKYPNPCKKSMNSLSERLKRYFLPIMPRNG